MEPFTQVRTSVKGSKGLALGGVWGGAPTFLAFLLAACAPSLTTTYDDAVRTSATRTPAFAVDLRTIPPDQATVGVATFTEWGAPPAPTTRLVWVSLPDQLRALCHDTPDPVLAIQEILGLPPQATPSRPDHQWQVFTFTVPRTALFRPCVGGGDIAAPRCGTTVGDDPTLNRFLLTQLWTSHQTGFTDPGYPFTGMGWTYDWDPDAKSPVGATELVLRIGTQIAGVASHTPAQFCAGY